MWKRIKGSNPSGRNQFLEYFTQLFVMTCSVTPDPTTGCPLANQVWLSWTDATAWSVSQLDPTMLVSALASGFILVATFWAIGKGCKVLLDFIRTG